MQQSPPHNDELQGKVNSQFVQSVVIKFRNHCSRDQVAETPDEMIRYLMQHNIIKQDEVNRYMVLDLYPKMMFIADGVKTRAIQMLEDHVPYNERNIWNIVGKMQKRFHLCKMITFQAIEKIVPEVI